VAANRPQNGEAQILGGYHHNIVNSIQALLGLRQEADDLPLKREEESPDDVARVLGINRSTIFGWLVRYRQGGWGRLDAKKRGGRPSKLNGRALAWIYEVVQKDPRQYKFKFALWTSVMVRDIIRRPFGVSLGRSSVCRLLNQMGLSAQRPLWRAYQQDPVKVEHRLQTEYPAIRRKALKMKAEIWFAHEAGVRSDAHAGTTWAPRGRTPIVSMTVARF